MTASAPLARSLACLLGMGVVLVSPGCGQEIFVFDGGTDAGDGGDAGGHDDDGGDPDPTDGGDGGGPVDTDAGPALTGIAPPSGFAAEGVTGPTWSGELRVQLAWANPAPVHVEVISSNPAVLSIADGGAVIVPAGATEASIAVSGHAQAALVWVTARRLGVTADAGVRVLGASEVPPLVALTPGSAGIASGGSVAFEVAVEFPSQNPVTVDLAVAPPSLGTLPATVVIPARTLDAGFVFAATGGGSGTVSASTTNTLMSAVRVLAPVLSEVAGESSGDLADEFVELYNPTDAGISLAGWKLDHRAQSGSVARYHEFGAAASIPPFGFFLVGQANFTGTPDERLTKTGSPQTGRTMSSDDGTIFLLNPLDGGVDRIGWGSSLPEGTAAGAMNGDQSLERKAHAASTAASMSTGADVSAGNAHDSDDNSLDFVLRTTRQPQNSASAPEP